MTKPAAPSRRRRFDRLRPAVEALEIRSLLAAGVGTFSPGTVTWSLRSTASPGPADVGSFQFGITLPVVGDWNGDGKDGIGIFDKKTTTWSLRQIATAGAADVGTSQFGARNAIPVIGDFTTPAPVGHSFATVTLRPLDLDLLGLKITSSPITATVSAEAGDGKLLGNILTTALNTLGATPDELTRLNTNLNAVLAQVVGVLNASTLTLPANVLATLSPALQTLASTGLITATPGATASILDLAIATADGTAPVNLNLLGVNVTTSNINLTLSAHTGDGLILGNLLYNVSNLLNSGGQSGSLLSLLSLLGL